MRKLLLVSSLALLVSTGAMGAQTVDTLSTDDLGSSWPTTWNAYLDAALSTNSGTARPTYAAAGTIWYNTTTKGVYFYDGAADIYLYTLDTTNHWMNPPIGGGTATIASSATVDLGSVAPAAITITGTSAISSFGTSMLQGQIKVVIFQSGLTLSYNGTSMVLPGGVDLAVEAGSSALVLCTSTGNYRVLSYQTLSGSGDAIASNTGLVNTTGGPAVPVATTLSAWLDSAISNARGTTVMRGVAGWVGLAPGTSGYLLKSNGAAADLSWTPPVTDTTGFTSCTTVTGSTGNTSTATCAEGYVLTGGGAHASSVNGVSDGYPSGNSFICAAAWRNIAGSVQGDLCTAYAICCH